MIFHAHFCAGEDTPFFGGDVAEFSEVEAAHFFVNLRKQGKYFLTGTRQGYTRVG